MQASLNSAPRQASSCQPRKFYFVEMHQVNKTKKKGSRSKSRSRKDRKEKKRLNDSISSLEERIQGLVIEKYDSWDFGKVKRFAPPADNPENHQAAVHIQRHMRGWWARLRFQIEMLQFKLDNKDLLTWRALAKVKDKTKTKMEKIKQKLLEKHEKSLAKETKEEQTAKEARKIIQALRDENKKVREKNEKIMDACRNLKSQNERLQSTTNQATDNIDILTRHAKHIKDTYEKLIIVEPRYKQSVEDLAEAVESRRQFCLSERRMKLAYVKCVGAVVDLAEEKLKDPDLLDEIVGYVLDTEDMDNEEPLPERVHVGDLQDKEEDDDSVDAHSVATYDSD